MESAEIGAAARAFAAERELIVWESFPWGGATVVWPAAEDLKGYLDVLQRVGARILYLEDDGAVLGFAANGVIHAFPSADLRQRLVDDPVAEGSDVDEGDEYGLSVSMADYSNPYYDYRSGRTIDGELRELVDRIVADERFDGHQSRRLCAEVTSHLDAEDSESVRSVAARVFNETVGKKLDNRAQQLVADLAGDPAFDPLAWGDDLHDFLSARVAEEDPRVLTRLQRELPGYARESGLARKAEREIAQSARQMLERIPPLVRDQLGFASKNATRLQIVSPYLDDELPDHRKHHVLRELVSIEADLYSATREARYATAVRKLLDLGIRKAEISRRLGISTSVMDRLASTHRSDVDLDAGDPIVATLAPEIG